MKMKIPRLMMDPPRMKVVVNSALDLFHTKVVVRLVVVVLSIPRKGEVVILAVVAPGLAQTGKVGISVSACLSPRVKATRN